MSDSESEFASMDINDFREKIHFRCFGTKYASAIYTTISIRRWQIKNVVYLRTKF